LKELEGVSRSEDVYVKSPGGGQWGELVLRPATSEEKQRDGVPSDRWVAVISERAASGQMHSPNK